MERCGRVLLDRLYSFDDGGHTCQDRHGGESALRIRGNLGGFDFLEKIVLVSQFK